MGVQGFLLFQKPPSANGAACSSWTGTFCMRFWKVVSFLELRWDFSGLSKVGNCPQSLTSTPSIFSLSNLQAKESRKCLVRATSFYRHFIWKSRIFLEMQLEWQLPNFSIQHLLLLHTFIPLDLETKLSINCTMSGLNPQSVGKNHPPLSRAWGKQ